MSEHAGLPIDPLDEFFYADTANSPMAWFYCAQTLFESANFILGGLQSGPAAKRLADRGLMDSHYNSYGLLLGCALECILKGLWVANGGILVRDGEYKGIPKVPDHNLLKLAESVRVNLSSDEAHVVDRLSYWIRVAGRYPIAKRPEEMNVREVPGRGPIAPGFFNSDDWQAARTVTARLLDELHDSMYGQRKRIED
jgi:hypothetical protein